MAESCQLSRTSSTPSSYFQSLKKLCGGHEDAAFWEKRVSVGQEQSLPVDMCLENFLAFSMPSHVIGVLEEHCRSTSEARKWLLPAQVLASRAAR